MASLQVTRTKNGQQSRVSWMSPSGTSMPDHFLQADDGQADKHPPPPGEECSMIFLTSAGGYTPTPSSHLLYSPPSALTRALYCLCTSEGTYPSRYLSASMAVSMLLTEWAEGRYQHQQGLAGPIILTVGPSLAQVTGGTVEAPATALISQAA